MNVSWSELLESIADLAKKDISKMSIFEFKSEHDEKLEPEIKVDDDLDVSVEVSMIHIFLKVCMKVAIFSFTFQICQFFFPFKTY